MSKNNPQNEYMQKSKMLASVQDILGVLTLLLAIVQCLTCIIPGKVFLTISGILLIMEFLASYFSSINFDKGHFERELALLDNSFSEKSIPNYDNETYYNNCLIGDDHIKLLANIHENALFTSNITCKMCIPYFAFSGIVFVLFLIKLFMSGMDDYSSLLLSFIVSSSFFNRAIKINSLKKAAEYVLKQANNLCNLYEKNPSEINILYSQIIKLVLVYENRVFESKIILNEKIFKKLNTKLSEEWNKIRDGYSIYNN